MHAHRLDDRVSDVEADEREGQDEDEREDVGHGRVKSWIAFLSVKQRVN